MKTPQEAEASLEANVMQMADGIPQGVPSARLGKELLDTLAENDRTPELQMAMLAATLAAALKIINRSILNTPTTEKEDPAP